MHLEPIAHLGPTRSEVRSRPRRLVTAWAIIALVILVVMTACAEGTAHDAQRGQQQDAKRTSVVQSVQETYTANIIAATPPPPTATAKP
jgi:hypothetical protein